MLPEPQIREDVAVVPGTDGQKMSKSYGNTIPLFAPRSDIEELVMGIVTDSSGDRPENVYAIHKLVKDERELETLYEEHKGKYKALKESLVEDLDAFIAPMREELTRTGARELRTALDVDGAVQSSGTVLLVVNSICGCAAGKARPGIAAALQHPRVPDSVTTVFAGADIEATARAREYLLPYPPSSPAIGLFRDGKLVFMMERRDIETRSAPMIRDALTAAFDEHC